MTEKASDKIKLKNTRVVFYNPEDEGYGTSITIDCTDKDVEQQIIDWVKENNIGKDNPGVANIKEYTGKDGVTTKQFNLKISDKTLYAGMNGLGQKDIGYGARVDIIAKAFTYSNKFTGNKERVGQSVSAIVVRSAAQSSNDSDLQELLGELDTQEDEVRTETMPF